MDQPIVKKTCPECGAQDYQFRSRKTIPAKENEPEAVETTYRCKACGKEWRVRAAVKS
jgi:DNA-directed RNA polymerase subunit M/transcription elongation factor TFIIS